MFEKAESASSLSFAVPFHVGTYFCIGAYKCDVVVVTKMGAYIHGVLILCGCMLIIPILRYTRAYKNGRLE